MTSINLVNLVEKMGVKLTHHGQEWRGPCPLHGGQSPTSFVIRQVNNEQFWRCYSKCQDSGGSIKFVMKLYNFTYKQALDYLGIDQPLPPAAHQPAPAPAAAPPPNDQWQRRAALLLETSKSCLWSEAGNRARSWLNQRGLTNETIKRWQLGFIPNDSFEPLNRWGLETPDKKAVWLPRGITIPCLDRGFIWFIKIRRAIGQPKTPQILGSKPALFGDFGLHQTALIVEGEFDAMLLHQTAAHLVGVATTGAAGHLPKGFWLDRLLSLQKIIVVGDCDPAGMRHNDKWQKFSSRVTTAKIPAGKDPTDYYKLGGNLLQWVNFILAKTNNAAGNETPLHPDPPALDKTIIYPASAAIAVPANQWQRLPTGEIQASYTSTEQLFWSVTMSQIMQAETKPATTPLEQGEMFPKPINHYLED